MAVDDDLAAVRRAMSQHIPDTVLFIANVIGVSTALGVAAKLTDSEFLAVLSAILPFMILIKIAGFFMFPRDDEPLWIFAAGFIGAFVAMGLAFWAADIATEAALFQLDSPRLQAFFTERAKVAEQQGRLFQRSLVIHCFQKPGPTQENVRECNGIAAFFNKHPIPALSDDD